MKRKLLSILALLVTVSLVGCGGSSTQGDVAKVESVMQKYYAAFAEGDIEGISSLMTEELLETDGPDIFTSIAFAKGLNYTYEIISMSVTIDENSAVVTTELETSFGLATESYNLLRESGSWKIHSKVPAITPVVEPAKPTPAEQPATSPTLALLKTEMETFLTYYKFKQFDKMWLMLHPDIQGIYGEQDEFIKNMEMRPNLKDWVIGLPQIVSRWASESTIDLVGTEKTYSNVAEIPVTFIYSTTSGEIEQSQMMNAIVVNNDWKFFIRKIKAPTSESTITSTPTPTPTPDPESLKTSRADPAVLNQVIRVDVDDWLDGKIIFEIEMIEIISGEEAWEMVYAGNQFNNSPGAGKEYILAKFRVKIVELQKEPYDINHAQFDVYSATGVEYTEFFSVAGLDPDLRANLFEGAEHIGYSAFIVKTDDSPVAVYSLRWDENAIWFDLRSE